MLFADGWPTTSAGTVAITGLTDNAGNEAVLSRLMTSKFPLVIILTEAVKQLQDRRLEMALQWIPRAQNKEADALSNGKFCQGSKDLRICVEVKDLRFKILPRMLAVADDLYRTVKEKREAKKKAPQFNKFYRKAAPKDKLKNKDSW